MEDAKISQDELQQPKSLYQQGRYPSVIDTDDLVFEMGRQLVGNLNKEKLLGNMLTRAKVLEKTVEEIGKAKQVAEAKVAPLKLSNEQYILNNQKLDAELVKVRKELEETRKIHMKKTADIKTQHREEVSALTIQYNSDTLALEKAVATKETEIEELKKKKKKR
jgi:hypothetical protein